MVNFTLFNTACQLETPPASDFADAANTDLTLVSLCDRKYKDLMANSKICQLLGTDIEFAI
jgi:hypothetical protein